LDVDRGVLVDETLRTSDTDIYAIGDVASHRHPVLGRRIRVEHWDTAIEQGKVVAHNLAGASEQYTRLPYFFTDQYDLGMEYFGSVGPDGYDRVDIEGDTDVANGGAFRAYWVKDGTVRAAMHANDWDGSDAVRDSIGTARWRRAQSLRRAERVPRSPETGRSAASACGSSTSPVRWQ